MVFGSAKAVFSASGDAGENEEKPKSPEPIQLVEEPVVQEPVVDEPVVEEQAVEEKAFKEPTFEEPKNIECFTEQNIEETEVERVETPETPVTEVVELRSDLLKYLTFFSLSVDKKVVAKKRS